MGSSPIPGTMGKWLCLGLIFISSVEFKFSTQTFYIAKTLNHGLEFLLLSKDPKNQKIAAQFTQ